MKAPLFHVAHSPEEALLRKQELEETGVYIVKIRQNKRQKIWRVVTKLISQRMRHDIPTKRCNGPCHEYRPLSMFVLGGKICVKCIRKKNKKT